MYVHVNTYRTSKWGFGHSPRDFELVIWFNIWRFCIQIGAGGYDS